MALKADNATSMIDGDIKGKVMEGFVLSAVQGSQALLSKEL